MTTQLHPVREDTPDDAASVASVAAPRYPGRNPGRSPGRIERRLSTGVLVGRWVVVAGGTTTVAIERRTAGPIAAVVLLAVVASVTTLHDRHVRRRTPDSVVPSPAALGLEVAVAALAVTVSGGLASPVVLAPAIPLVFVGHQLARHRAAALACFALVAAPLLLRGGITVRDGSDTFVLVLVVDGLSVALGTAVRFVEEAYAEVTAQHDARLEHLATANRNLIALHDFARSMTTSLDLREVLQRVEGQVTALSGADYVTLFVRHDASGQWVPELSRGTRTLACTDDDLPYSLRRALLAEHCVVLDDGLRHHAATVAPLARSGLYTALRAADRVVGVLAVEHDSPGAYDQRDAAAIDGAAAELTLTIDNALWFARLRTIGAEAERARIARELHDRIAQSVAYASFELERLAAGPTPPQVDELLDLHTVMRSVGLELRDTLYDLRATVTEDADLATVAARFVRRLEERHGVEIRCRFRVEERLPTLVEVELWRIVQEALQNFVRHAQTSSAELTIDVHDGAAHVTLRDYGRGFVARNVDDGHYGLVGMRERAEAIGARLGIESRPQHGTTVRLDLEVPR